MFTIEYNTTRYFTSPLNSSLPTSNYSEIFLRRFNEMKKKIKSLYDGDGSKNSRNMSFWNMLVKALLQIC